MMTRVVSVVSGKGGSGKSLLTAVLGQALAREGENVLLVDMDIFVRGLTVLLYSFRRPKRDGNSTVSDLLGIFSNESQDRGPVETDASTYKLERFHECDVLPAVSNIGEPLDYDDTSLSDEKFCQRAIERIIKSTKDRYDYIFLDNRAGMDSLIAASCRAADIVLAVAEDDAVGRQTNTNLVQFLQTRKSVRIIYSIINKARGLRSYPEVQDRSKQKQEFNLLGFIPFDIEIMESFGSDRFWGTVTETLYFRSLLDVRNELTRLEPVTELSERKYKFPPSVFMRKQQGRFSLIERMLRGYSVLLILAGVMMWLYGRYESALETPKDWYELMSIVSIIVGGLALALSTSGILLRRGKDQRDRDR